MPQFNVEQYQDERGFQFVIVMTASDGDCLAQYVYDTVYRDQLAAERVRRTLVALPVINLDAWHERDPAPRRGN